jgi:hypothetical protein
LFPKIGDALILFYFALPLSQFRGMIEENQIGLQLELEMEAPLNNFFSKLSPQIRDNLGIEAPLDVL